MVIALTKRSVMTFYSDPQDVYSHRCRIVLAEKGVSVDIIDIHADEKPEDLLELNPYNTLPTLIDRDLVLYESNIIMEYLDERFPHPPLMPVYPVARAQTRLMLHRIDTDWYGLMNKIHASKGVEQQTARQHLLEGLLSVMPIFEQTNFFLSEEFSLVDCSLAALFWRLPLLGIQLPKKAQPLLDYCQRIFSRDSFQLSLSTIERTMHD
jgi:RNA polymerase-associated protein